MRETFSKDCTGVYFFLEDLPIPVMGCGYLHWFVSEREGVSNHFRC